MRLAVGELRSGIDIRARSFWNSTEIEVEAGERYLIEAAGRWNDGGKSCDANGFTTEEAPAISRWLLRRYEAKRRMPDQPWFRLIGALGKDNALAFPLGRVTDWTADRAGVLHCFANDVPSAYWNNFKKVVLTIRRLA